MDIGSLRHSVRLENPTTVTADGDGGFTTSWAMLSPGIVYASIEPATQRSLERLVANAVSSDASHVVTMRYHPSVTTKTRIVFATRVLNVVGIQNVNERNEVLRLACVEQVA
jgi:SPP1 family predicted phage head-tail adaptor